MAALSVTCIVAFLKIFFLPCCQCTEYFVVAEDGAICPEGTICHDLSYFAKQSETYFTSDTTVTFLQGTHILGKDGPVVISNVSNLTLQGGVTEDRFHWSVKQANVIVTCPSKKESGILIKDFSSVKLTGLTLVGCGFHLPEEIRLFIQTRYLHVEYASSYTGNWNSIGFFSLLVFSGTNLLTDDLFIQNSTGYGLAIINVCDVKFGYDLFPTLSIIVNASSCPPGFSILDANICDCNEYVASTGAICNINSTSITTNGSVWIGYDNTTNETIYSYNCPYDYCVNKNVSFNILDPDQQCANHRSGVLCGGCADGYSLLLGSNECGKCSNNNYLSLLLVFGIAGIVLVVLLIVFNRTVSVGTINGLIFYANIVKINEKVLFPNGPVGILSQFISFINLDFGIKTCFYDGMTTYQKACLQFVFPLYILVIMCVIILLARHFTRLAQLIGDNNVKVSATLLLLSNTKIIRAAGVFLESETVNFNGKEQSMWRYDGNIVYQNLNPILFLLFCLVISYSFFLLSFFFNDWLLANISSKFISLKTFSKAYTESFVEGCRQLWSGLLIIVYVFLTVIKGKVCDTNLNSFTIMCIFILFALLITFKVYKNAYLNILEAWFLLNLLIVLYPQKPYGNVLNLILIAFATVTPFAILIVQGFQKIRRIDSGGDILNHPQTRRSLREHRPPDRFRPKNSMHRRPKRS